MFHLNHPREVIQQHDARFMLCVSYCAGSWVYHLDFTALPRPGGWVRYSQPSGQSRECAIERGLAEAQHQLSLNRGAC